MKPTVTQIAHAFKVEPDRVLDTRIQGHHPSIRFARSALFMLHWYANPIAAYHVGRELGISVATSYRWQLWHREHMQNPMYARIFAKLRSEAA